eukprot:276905-Amphidinium_carterae.1
MNKTATTLPERRGASVGNSTCLRCPSTSYVQPRCCEASQKDCSCLSSFVQHGNSRLLKWSTIVRPLSSTAFEIKTGVVVVPGEGPGMLSQ